MPYGGQDLHPFAKAYMAGKQYALESQHHERKAELESQRMALERQMKELELGEAYRRMKEEHKAKLEEIGETGERQKAIEKLRQTGEMEREKYRRTTPEALHPAMEQYYRALASKAKIGGEEALTFPERMALQEMQGLVRILTADFTTRTEKEAAARRMEELRRVTDRTLGGAAQAPNTDPALAAALNQILMQQQSMPGSRLGALWQAITGVKRPPVDPSLAPYFQGLTEQQVGPQAVPPPSPWRR